MAFTWQLEPGCAYLVFGTEGCSGDEKLLDCLAGRRPDKRLKMELALSATSVRQLSALPSAGLLPPPGDEIFVGTTIAEQLSFFTGTDSLAALAQSSLDRLFGFNFGGRLDESVWELGAGERRCLLLVSQALAEPRYWILHQPLARMDGPRSEAMLEFIHGRCAKGETVIASQRPAEELLGCCRYLLALDGDSTDVKFYGGGLEAARYLATETGLELSALET